MTDTQCSPTYLRYHIKPEGMSVEGKSSESYQGNSCGINFALVQFIDRKPTFCLWQCLG